jgi:hypothetical protein
VPRRRRRDRPRSAGSISNHYFGRGVDIAVVDGSPVTVTNAAALALTSGLSSLDPSCRPDEVGSPWAMPRPGYFTDADNQDKIHIAFKRPVDPGWTPPV